VAAVPIDLSLTPVRIIIKSNIYAYRLYVTWHLKGGIVESEETVVARQWSEKHVRGDGYARDNIWTVEAVFSVRLVLRQLYSEGHRPAVSGSSVPRYR
jgi:hypothetical protein